MRLFVLVVILLTIESCGDNNEIKVISTKPDVNQKETSSEQAKRANKLYENGSFRNCVTCYDSLIKVDSIKAGYFFKRGYCKMMAFDSVGAISDYRNSIALNYSQKDLAYFNLAIIYQLMKKRYDSAIYFYDKYLNINPQNSEALEGKKYCLKKLGK